MSGTTGQDVYRKVCLDAGQKVSDAVRELQGLSEELTEQASGQVVPMLRLPESWEQHMQGMSMADIYEETLRMLPDDVKVTVAYRHPACKTRIGYDGTTVSEVESVTVEKRCLRWTDNVLMITRVKGDMGTFTRHSYDTDEIPANINEEMPEAYTTLVPMGNVMAVDVAWKVDLEDLRQQVQDEDEWHRMQDDGMFEEFEFEEETESMFSDIDPSFEDEFCPSESLPERVGTVRITGRTCDVLRLANGDLVIEHPEPGCAPIPITLSDVFGLAQRGQIRLTNEMIASWACPSDDSADGDEAFEWPARGAISSYEKNGKFVNCFQLRNMDLLRSKEAFKLPPVATEYRRQLESAFKKNKKVTMTGTLSSAVRYDNCIRLVLSDITITKGAGGHLSHMNLFVSRDYKAPEIGSKLSVDGFVYAYSPANLSDRKKQLAINATTVRTVG